VLLSNRLPIEKLILIDIISVHVKLTQLQKEAQEIRNAEELSFLNLSDKKQFKKAMHQAQYMPNF